MARAPATPPPGERRRTSKEQMPPRSPLQIEAWPTGRRGVEADEVAKTVSHSSSKNVTVPLMRKKRFKIVGHIDSPTGSGADAHSTFISRATKRGSFLAGLGAADDLDDSSYEVTPRPRSRSDEVLRAEGAELKANEYKKWLSRAKRGSFSGKLEASPPRGRPLELIADSMGASQELDEEDEAAQPPPVAALAPSSHDRGLAGSRSLDRRSSMKALPDVETSSSDEEGSFDPGTPPPTPDQPHVRNLQQPDRAAASSSSGGGTTESYLASVDAYDSPLVGTTRELSPDTQHCQRLAARVGGGGVALQQPKRRPKQRGQVWRFTGDANDQRHFTESHCPPATGQCVHHKPCRKYGCPPT